jgi:TP901 family phage tail tape measure protein
MKDVGGALTAGVTAPIVALGTASLKSFNDVDAGMDVMIKATGATGDVAKSLEESFRNVSGSVTGTFEDIGGAIGEVNTRFGVTGEKLDTMSTDFLKFARITGIDATEGVRLVSRAMSDAGIDSSQYKTILDQLSAASQASGISIETLTESLAKYGAPMRALGFDTQESIALFAGWEKAGVNTEIAFSGMKKAISNWSADGKDAREEFGKTLTAIKSAPDIASATSMAIDVFGQKAGPDLADAIQGGRFEFEDFLAVVEGSGGTLDSTYDELLDGGDRFEMSMQNIEESLAGLGETIMTVAAPMIEDLASGVEQLSGWFDSLSPGMQEGAVVAGGLAAATGPLLMIFGSMAGGLSNILGLLGSSGLVGAAGGATGATSGLSAAFTALTGPVGLAVAAVAAISAVIAGAWQNSEIFRDSVGKAFLSVSVTTQEAFARITEAMGPALTSFQGFSADVTPILQQIGDFLGTYIVPIVKDFFNNFINGFADVIVAIAPFIEGIGNLLSFIGNFVGAVFALFNGDWAAAWTFAQAAGQSFIDFLGNGLEGAKNIVFLVFGDIINKILETWQGIQTSTTEVWNVITSFLKETWDSIYNNTIGKIKETAQGVADKWQETKNDTNQKWNDIKDGIKEKWDQIYANVTEKVKATKDDVAQKWEDTKLDSQQKWSDIKEDLKTKVGEIYENTISKAQGILEGLSLKWDKIRTDAGTKWDEIKQRISSAVSGLPDELKGIGSAMMTKMAEGIAATIEEVYTGVTTLVTEVIKRFKEGFGINSPSTVLKEIGQFMIEGLIKGLSGDNLMSFVDNIVENLKSAFSSGVLNVGTLMATLGSSAADLLAKLGINLGGLGFSAAGLNGMVWGSPTGTSVFDENFAWDEDFGDRAGSVGSQYHEGLDFNDTVGGGSPLYAIQNGVVSSAGYNGGYGNQVILDFGNGIAASYSHLDSIGVEAGQNVVMGQYIGAVGNTGASYGAHLHFGLLINGQYVDPMQLWSGASFDVGSRYVPEDMIAMIHKGEAIIPADQNPYANSGGPILSQGTKVEFTQNNYSPKELSPSESARFAKRGLQELALMMG